MICALLAAAMYLLLRNKARFGHKVYVLLQWALVCTIISELAFAFYIDNYGLSNLVGHYFKIFSFAFVYSAIISTGIKEPYQLIFHELHAANGRLRDEISVRQRAEEEKEGLIGELRVALEEIKTLEGILPICMHCKKIRDDGGYWKQLENYIHERSKARFSHSICPDCFQKHYPDLIAG